MRRSTVSKDRCKLCLQNPTWTHLYQDEVSDIRGIERWRTRFVTDYDRRTCQQPVLPMLLMNSSFDFASCFRLKPQQPLHAHGLEWLSSRKHIRKMHWGWTHDGLAREFRTAQIDIKWRVSYPSVSPYGNSDKTDCQIGPKAKSSAFSQIDTEVFISSG